MRRIFEASPAPAVGDDLLDLFFVVAQPSEGRRYGVIDYFEVSAAGQFLELHKCEVGFDSGGVAIHHETDRAGGGDDGGLGVAVTVPLAQFKRLIPGFSRGR